MPPKTFKQAAPTPKVLPCQVDGGGKITVGQTLLLKCDLPGNFNLAGDISFYDSGTNPPYTIAFLDKPVVKDGQITVSFTSYKTGSYDFSQILLKTQNQIYLVGPFHVEVTTVLPQQAQGQPEPTPFPSVDPQKLSVPWWWWAIWVGLIVTLLTFAIVRFRRHLKARRAAMESLKPGKVLTPQERFGLALQKLESQGYHSRGDYKKFALELTVILKKSIGEKFKFIAEDMTTEEFFETLNSRHSLFWREAEDLNKFVFESLDQIKFAKVETSQENCISLLDQSRKLGNILFRGEP